MTTEEKVENLIAAIADLPDDAQSELLQSLIEMRAPHLRIEEAE
jgi:hypothetical protein